MSERRLSLVSELTPAQQAERDCDMIASAYPAKSLEVRLLREIMIAQGEIKAMLAGLQPPKQDITELVSAKVLVEELGISENSANVLIHKIGSVRVGPGGGSVRCRRDDLERYKSDPDGYTQRRAA